MASDNNDDKYRTVCPNAAHHNKTKKARRSTAVKLPDEIHEIDIPLYVSYTIKKSKDLEFPYFKVQEHPAKKNGHAKKEWCSSFDNSTSIQEKLAEAYRYLEELGDVFEWKPDYVLNARDPSILATEGDFVLTKDMLPDKVRLQKPCMDTKNNCAIGYTFFYYFSPYNKRAISSQSPHMSLKDKYEEMLVRLEKLRQGDAPIEGGGSDKGARSEHAQSEDLDDTDENTSSSSSEAGYSGKDARAEDSNTIPLDRGVGAPRRVTNKYVDIDNDTCELHIEDTTGRTARVLIDAKSRPQVAMHSWTLTSDKNRSCKQPYIVCGSTLTLLHRFIMDLNNDQRPSDKHSVDHINRNTLDNRYQNLRWATHGEQIENRDKVARLSYAQGLPEGLTEPLPKFCEYYKGGSNGGDRGTLQEYFVVTHPMLRTRFDCNRKKTSTKAPVGDPQTIFDKLSEAYDILEKCGVVFESKPEYVLRSDVTTKSRDTLAAEDGFVLSRSALPKYVTFIEAKGNRGHKFEIIFEKKKGGRQSTSGARKVSLRTKYADMMRMYLEMLPNAPFSQACKDELVREHADRMRRFESATD